MGVDFVRVDLVGLTLTAQSHGGEKARFIHEVGRDENQDRKYYSENGVSAAARHF